MKDHLPKSQDEGRLIASWGEAKLIKYFNGEYELKGGSEEDRIAARKWIVMFCQNEVVREIPPSP